MAKKGWVDLFRIEKFGLIFGYRYVVGIYICIALICRWVGGLGGGWFLGGLGLVLKFFFSGG